MTLTSNIQVGATGASFPPDFGAASSACGSDSALGSFAELCSSQLSISSDAGSPPEPATVAQDLSQATGPTLPGVTPLGTKASTGKATKNPSADPAPSLLSVSLITIPPMPTLQEVPAIPQQSISDPQPEDICISSPQSAPQPNPPAPQSLPPSSTAQETTLQATRPVTLNITGSGPVAEIPTASQSPSKQAGTVPSPVAVLLDQTSDPATPASSITASTTIPTEGGAASADSLQMAYIPASPGGSTNGSEPILLVQETPAVANVKISGAGCAASKEAFSRSIQTTSNSRNDSIIPKKSSFLDLENGFGPTPDAANPAVHDVPEADATSQTTATKPAALPANQVQARKQSAPVQSTAVGPVEQDATKAAVSSLMQAIFADPTVNQSSRLLGVSSLNALPPSQRAGFHPNVSSMISSLELVAPAPDPMSVQAVPPSRTGTKLEGPATSDCKNPSIAMISGASKESTSTNLGDSDTKDSPTGPGLPDLVGVPSLLVSPATPTVHETAPQGVAAPSSQKNAAEPGAPEPLPPLHPMEQLANTAATGSVQLARVLENVTQSEMRIGLNTTAFGSVQVRTVVHASEVGVQIGSEKGDLRSLLSHDIPGIAHNLQQQDLRLTQVSFQQNGASYSGDSSQHNAQSRPFSYRQNATAASTTEAPFAETGAFAEVKNISRSGLSILA